MNMAIGILFVVCLGLLASCVDTVVDGLVWDYRNKCAAGAKPVVKVSCK